MQKSLFILLGLIQVMQLQNEEGVWLNYETALQFKLVDELEE